MKKVNTSDYVEWCVLAKQGSEHAWAMLYRHFQPQVMSYALSLCGNTDQVHDIIQESFITAYTKLHQLKVEAAFPSWLRSIVRHQAFRLFRPSKIRHHVEWSDDIHSLNCAEGDEHGQSFDSIYKALAQLPESYRVAMMLRTYSTCNSYEELAQILAVPIGTIRSRLSEARRRLLRNWSDLSTECENHDTEASMWDEYYEQSFNRFYDDPGYRDNFLGHFHPELVLEYTSDQYNRLGYSGLEKIIYDDIEHGSITSVLSSHSSENLSILNCKCENSDKHPHRCPPTTIMVLSRRDDQVHHLRLYHSSRVA